MTPTKILDFEFQKMKTEINFIHFFNHKNFTYKLTDKNLIIFITFEFHTNSKLAPKTSDHFQNFFHEKIFAFFGKKWIPVKLDSRFVKVMTHFNFHYFASIVRVNYFVIKSGLITFILGQLKIIF